MKLEGVKCPRCSNKWGIAEYGKLHDSYLVKCPFCEYEFYFSFLKDDGDVEIPDERLKILYD